MKFTRGPLQPGGLPDKQRVITIGNFDGVHLGHQTIFNQIKHQAQQRGLESCVVLFEPQPQEFFLKQNAPARLSTLREKLKAIHALSLDRVICLSFNREFASLSAESFVRQLLHEALNTRHVVIGDDFRFGIKRQAGYEELQEFGNNLGFSLERTESCLYENKRISSSWVREVLAVNDFKLAAKLLGRPFSISGRVRHGDKRGREIGFPTMNIDMRRHNSPLKGVFVSSVIVDNADGSSERWPAVTNIGTRPVFQGTGLLMETHMLNHTANMYGKHINVEFHEKLRDEQHFDGIDALRKQINHDVGVARQFFKL